MLQYYILTNVIIALFFMIEIQRAVKWSLEEGFGVEFIGVLILIITIVTPWITYSCRTFECFK